MPDLHTLVETERATADRIGGLSVDVAAAHAVSSLYRAGNAARAHLTNQVLREHDLTWTGFLVLWLLWIWGEMTTRDVAQSVGVSKATLSGVANTLVKRALIERVASQSDRRKVGLRLTDEGVALMDGVYTRFNQAEAEIVSGLTPRQIKILTNALRTIVTTLESEPDEEDHPRTAR